MRSRSLWFATIVASGLLATTGLPATSWGQTGFSTGDSGANGANGAVRLPATDDLGNVETASAEIPAQSAATNARVAALEAKIAELDELLQTPPPAAPGYIVGSNASLFGKWTNDGATLQSKNGDFRWKFRGLAQLDLIGMQNPGGGVTSPNPFATQDSVTFRRLRMGAEGTMYETIDWVFECDFALALQNIDPTVSATPITGLRSTGTTGSAPLSAQAGNTTNAIQPSTIFMTFTQLPIIGNVRVGNQQDWISLEHIESARFLDFMERSPIMDAFNGANNNGYTPGISAFNMTENKRAAWELGIYKNNVYDTGYTYDLGNNNYTYGGRATWTPYYDEATEGRYLVHTGFGTEYRTFNTELAGYTQGTNIRVRSRGDLRNTSSTLDPNYADTGNFYATSQGLLCPEMAIVWGPWLIQAEYEQSYMNQAAVEKGGTRLGQVMFQGGYVEALYFLTGENRQYNRQSGVFNRVVPFENAFLTRGARGYGRGAWQLGLRFDWLDLNSGAVQGGNAQDATVGLNWFLNPNARFQFNYVCSWINNSASPLATTSGSLQPSRFSGDGTINSLGCRMDFNF